MFIVRKALQYGEALFSRLNYFGWMYTCGFIGIDKMQNDTKD